MQKNTYSASGVDIDKASKLVEDIKQFANTTSKEGVMNGIGGFGGLFSLNTQKYNNPVLVSSTDGVGTKLLIAQSMNKHDTIGIDLVAMCANDILCHGAEPLFFLDYFATGKLELASARAVIKGIAQGCKEANMALIGGETAEMPGVYNNKYDLAGFCLGAVEHDEILPSKNIQAGDLLIGLSSSGLHSNGFSLVRKVLSELKITVHEQSPWQSKSWGEVLLQPTSIYVQSVLPILKNVKGLAHITGGGMIENIPRILPPGLTFVLDQFDWPEIFLWLQKEGNIEKQEMLKVFNCGIGMVLIVTQDKSTEVIKKLLNNKITAQKIGYITDIS